MGPSDAHLASVAAAAAAAGYPVPSPCMVSGVGAVSKALVNVKTYKAQAHHAYIDRPRTFVVYSVVRLGLTGSI